MKRCRLKRYNSQMINKMNIEEKLKEQVQNGNDFIADVSNLYFEKSKLDIKLNVGINHCIKMLMGIEDDYLDDV